MRGEELGVRCEGEMVEGGGRRVEGCERVRRGLGT